jgi:hypothetical protein
MVKEFGSSAAGSSGIPNRIFVFLLRKMTIMEFEYTGEEGVEISGKTLS